MFSTSFSKSIPRLWTPRQEIQSMAGSEPDNGLGGRGTQISPDSVEATTKVPNVALRAFYAAWRAIGAVMS